LAPGQALVEAEGRVVGTGQVFFEDKISFVAFACLRKKEQHGSTDLQDEPPGCVRGRAGKADWFTGWFGWGDYKTRLGSVAKCVTREP